MSEKLELEIKKRLNSLQSSIETATGESYEDLTGAINAVFKLAKWKDYIQQGLYNTPSVTHAIFRNVANPDILDLDFSKMKTLNSMFIGNNALEVFTMDLSNTQDVTSFLGACRNLKRVVLSNTGHIKNWTNSFDSCGNLLSIETLDFTSTTGTNSIFAGCRNLESVKVVPKTLSVSISFWASPSLSAESKKNIFDGLATVTTAQTLTFSSNTKVLQSQIDSANAKGWTVANARVVSEEEYYE